MAVWVTLPGYPEKGMEGRLSIDYGWDHDHPRSREARFELEVVRRELGFSVRPPHRRPAVRVPALCREGLTVDEAVDVMFVADNGSAAHLVRALAGAEVERAAWDRHLAAARAAGRLPA